MSREHTGVLLVRVWLEGHDPVTVRARVTQRLEVGDPEETTIRLAGREAITDAVRAWLETFVRNAGRQPQEKRER